VFLLSSVVITRILFGQKACSDKKEGKKKERKKETSIVRPGAHK